MYLRGWTVGGSRNTTRTMTSLGSGSRRQAATAAAEVATTATTTTDRRDAVVAIWPMLDPFPDLDLVPVEGSESDGEGQS